MKCGIWPSAWLPFILVPEPIRQTHLPYFARPSQVVPAATVVVALTVTLVQAGGVRFDGAACTLAAITSPAIANRTPRAFMNCLIIYCSSIGLISFWLIAARPGAA